LYSNTIGFNNTAGGYEALYSNTTGIVNTATGSSALRFNTTGESNTATGLPLYIPIALDPTIRLLAPELYFQYHGYTK
jgi:hypothetical protein